MPNLSYYCRFLSVAKRANTPFLSKFGLYFLSFAILSNSWKLSFILCKIGNEYLHKLWRFWLPKFTTMTFFENNWKSCIQILILSQKSHHILVLILQLHTQSSSKLHWKKSLYWYKLMGTHQSKNHYSKRNATRGFKLFQNFPQG